MFEVGQSLGGRGRVGGRSQGVRQDRRRERSIYSAVKSLSTVRENLVIRFQAGRMNIRCPHCEALHWDGEKNTRRLFTMCCGQGQINLPPITAPSP